MTAIEIEIAFEGLLPYK